jgi:hypothetical protein
MISRTPLQSGGVPRTLHLLCNHETANGLSKPRLKGKLMKSEVGLWIDNRKAVIVTIMLPQDGIGRMQANLEKQVRFSEDLTRDNRSYDWRDNKFSNYLGSYYDDVMDCIRDAEFIQIFGPGDAKLELEKRLKHEKLGGCIVKIETIDKMTDRQIEAKVWQHFLA